MASKSKRRGRVFRASCILAALIIAGSSFAWFTSSDEVTNRLTANSDYGVSIVESFSPPKNWIPGQNINKDTYAVNTGNIDAFVKNEVKGVLNYTYEKLVSTLDTTNGVVLNDAEVAGIEGATTMEAGSFLAYTSVATEPLGDKNVKYDGTAWKPTESGVYIFRRAIDTETGTLTPANPAFTYSGYYFDKDSGKYYKIVIGEDKHPYDTNHNFDVSSKTLGTNVTIDKDGKVTDGIPVVNYVTLGTVENENVIFTYEAKDDDPTTGHPARLVATSNGAYRTTDTNTPPNVYDESATAARAEVDYKNKQRASDIAEARYKQVEADYKYAKTLEEERDKLTTAANTAKAAYDAVNGTSSGTAAAQTTARNGVKTQAEALEADGTNYKKLTTPSPVIDPSLDSLVSATMQGAITAMGTTSETYKNYEALKTAYANMYTASDNRVSKINTALANLKNTATYNTPALVTAELETLKKELNNLKNDLNAYKIKVADLVESASQEATGLDLSSTANGIRTNVDTLLSYYDIDLAALETAVSNYTTAYANNTSSAAALVEAETNWKKAEHDYNTAVGAAKTAYETAVGDGTTPLTWIGADGNTYTFTNNAKKIVDVYSANRVNDGEDPTITEDNVDCYAHATTPGNQEYAKDYLYYADFVPGANTASNASNNPVLPNTTNTTNDVWQTGGTTGFKEFTVPNYVPDTPTPTVTDVQTLKNAMDTAKNAAATAKRALTDAQAALTNTTTGAGAIKIYVNLADDYATNWTMDQATLNTTEVDFYLNKILAAGATSDKLIDSVEMADTVTAGAYKDMTFDLNVGLDSAQITYADDQTTITDKAVVTPDPFGMKVTSIDQSSGALTWGALTAPVTTP